MAAYKHATNDSTKDAESTYWQHFTTFLDIFHDLKYLMNMKKLETTLKHLRGVNDIQGANSYNLTEKKTLITLALHWTYKSASLRRKV